ncbi:PorP/SprF family type IX secretion system membrane protein [Chitinophaga arvensicola]|uniref:Type IX secretion system membrane protein, PorP/SprF family n=1 Tax=Chitinophaga arvensicola TaxID=29529 RepID=A0A1I0PG50_9BACT|nr:PorP/SprF family type IX secretion system membrane protein [Chitinophaga arvensicola]SEW13291.1 type IX secretion system membrane protein, PorP/SprF family [Chitinophaga arvensicola]
MRNKSYIRLLLLSGLFLLSMKMKAQSFSSNSSLLEPSATQYFQNQYLANPAMAGIDSGLHVNASYRNQWSDIAGAPVTKFLSADGNFGRRVGGGLRIFNDAAGLLNRTRVALSYAYHLPLNSSNQQLSFGLSLALNLQRLNTKDLNGEVNDPSIGAFNRRDDYFEAEYGMAYTNGHLNLQGAVPNIRSLFSGNNNTIDGGNIFFTAASYQFTPEGVISKIEPKLCYRGVKDYDNILDIGLNVAVLENVANVMAMYHTSKSMTAGIGVNIMKTVAIQALYTTQTGGIKTYVNGTYEIGASIHLFR